MPEPWTSVRSLSECATNLAAFARDASHARTVDRACTLLAERLRAGGKLLAIGNGGSACDAAHFCEELTGRFRKDRPPLAAIACTEPGHITCTANDFGYDEVFARWVDALARADDALIALSTSGNSENVVRAVERAKARGVLTITLLGKGGGRLRGVGDVEIIAPGETADRIQEVHKLVLHTLVEGVEHALGHA
ncbi:MAG: SIS domain-containing protein [Phycisphaerales bacterium]|jgi:D-sedoheptulose 7-phosphate isomerase|nr:SIS domain-containing protein [Phycisphaerales bacterium]